MLSGSAAAAAAAASVCDKSADINTAAVVEDFDPVTMNDNAAARVKVCALLASHPSVKHFEAGRSYKYVSLFREYEIRLVRALKVEEKPFVVDLNSLSLLSAEGYKRFAAYLQHLKQHSIRNAMNLNLRKDIIHVTDIYHFAYLDENGVVTFLNVKLSDTLVVYQCKKDQADKRFAILDKKISTGNYGSIFASNRSLACSSENSPIIVVNNKKPEKRRVVKIQKDKISKSRQALIADLEYEMTLALAPELAVKPLAKHAGRQLSAMLMRYVPGKDLFNTVNCRVFQTDLERLEICLSAAEALKVVHDRGGIHRDVKPENFIVEQGDDGVYRLTLVDYGLSIMQTRQDNNFSGTPLVMAPELLAGANVTAASDVYSLCRLMEIVFGYMPSWEPDDCSLQESVRILCENATMPFDMNMLGLDKSNRDYLDKLGFKAILDGMRTQTACNRMPLVDVIERLKALINDFKKANESRSIFPSAMAAAQSNQIEPDRCDGAKALRQ